MDYLEKTIGRASTFEEDEEKPPNVSYQSLSLVSSFIVARVFNDDTSSTMYMREEAGEKDFFENYLPHAFMDSKGATGDINNQWV